MKKRGTRFKKSSINYFLNYNNYLFYQKRIVTIIIINFRNANPIFHDYFSNFRKAFKSSRKAQQKLNKSFWKILFFIIFLSFINYYYRYLQDYNYWLFLAFNFVKKNKKALKGWWKLRKSSQEKIIFFHFFYNLDYYY